MTKKISRVLLVDDDDATNFINKKVIEQAGIVDEVDIKLNGKEAIDYVNHLVEVKKLEQPDPMLILLDLNMPLMDGWEFLQEYNKLVEDKKLNVIIIVLTTSSNPDDRTKAKGYNQISAFIQKPLTVEALIEITKNA